VPLRSAHASSVLQAVWHLALSMPRCEARRLMPRERVTGYRTAILGNGTRAAKSNATITAALADAARCWSLFFHRPLSAGTGSVPRPSPVKTRSWNLRSECAGWRLEAE